MEYHTCRADDHSMDLLGILINYSGLNTKGGATGLECAEDGT
jgi:hypothetical protein